jgi:hypothetical protein
MNRISKSTTSLSNGRYVASESLKVSAYESHLISNRGSSMASFLNDIVLDPSNRPLCTELTIFGDEEKVLEEARGYKPACLSSINWQNRRSPRIIREFPSVPCSHTKRHTFFANLSSSERSFYHWLMRFAKPA